MGEKEEAKEGAKDKDAAKEGKEEKKEKVITSSTTNEVKQIETQEETTVSVTKALEKVTRRQLRQKCAVMFPAVFTQFTKQKSMKTSGMCPCQGSATGVSQVSLAIDAPEEADRVVQ